MKQCVKKGDSKMENKFLNRITRAKRERSIRYGHRYATF